MARRVNHHPDEFLRLIRRQPGACGEGMSQSDLEIIDFEVEMNHHLLFGGIARPHRWHEIRLGGERQSHAAVGRTQRHPVGFDFPEGAPKQPLIKGSVGVSIGRIEHDLRQ